MSMYEDKMAIRAQAIEEGITRVLKNPKSAAWQIDYLNGAAEWLRQRGKAEFHGGQMYEKLLLEVGKPHHHNLWAAMLQKLEHMGWIEKVGEWDENGDWKPKRIRPDTRQSHIGAVQVWRSTGRV